MTRLATLLLLASLVLGQVFAAQDEPGIAKEVDAQTATDVDMEIDPPLAGSEEIDADALNSEAEVEAAFRSLAAASKPAWSNEAARFLATQDDLSIFVMLLEQANLTDTLALGDRQLTLFAPSDDAFGEMDVAEFEALVADPNELRAFLQRHIAIGDYSTSAIRTGLVSGADVTAGGPGEKVATASANVEPVETAAASREAVGATAARGAATDPADSGGLVDVESAATGSTDPGSVAGVETPVTARPDGGEAANVAGGGSAGGAGAATVPAIEPVSSLRVETRAGTDLVVGTRPTSVRAELMRLEGSDAPGRVAGGGEAEVEQLPLYVGEAQIIGRDLSIEGLTVHIIDRVLLPTPEDSASAR